MRDDLVVPGEGEENYVLARDARVVTTYAEGKTGGFCTSAKAEGNYR